MREGGEEREISDGIEGRGQQREEMRERELSLKRNRGERVIEGGDERERTQRG